MSLNQVQNAFDLLGQAHAPLSSRHLPGSSEPQLHVRWGDFRQSLWSSLRALFSGPRSAKELRSLGFFRDSWVERRIPVRAVVAAALWHVLLFVMPFPQFPTARKNPAFDNVALTWSGSINDLPLLDIPREKSNPNPPAEIKKHLPVQGADAFHPRQRIFTDPVHPTHPRQTLINPAAPFEPPTIVTNLPNIVQFQQTGEPARPRLQISQETLKQLRPRERRVATVTSAPLPDVPNMEQRPAEISIAVSTSGPARPKLELNTGAAPRLAPRAQTGSVVPAPEVGNKQMSAANENSATLIALSATPAPPAPVVQVPQGNLAARISLSPEGEQPGAPAGSPGAEPGATGNASAAAGSKDGNNPTGVSISGGNPPSNNGLSGLGGASPKMSAPSPRVLVTRPNPRVNNNEDIPERTGPPDFAALPAGAKPEQIFASKRVYTLNVNMPNLNSATGSWILNFSELRRNPEGPHVISSDLSGPAPLKKVDPKYPPSLVSDRVEGEVVLYAVIRRDGSVDSIQLVHGIDEQLDENAINALGQWKFRPAAKQGTPVELEAIVHIPFRIPQFR
jgi:TonB family protein